MMSEGEVVEQLVEFTSILLLGVSVLFTIVSAYVVALNYFIGDANLNARVAAFAFLSLILGLLVMVMAGAQATHMGLIERLHEIESQGGLSAAGRATLANATGGIDAFVRACIWLGLGAVYLSLGYLTFIHRWTPDVVNVALQSRKAS
jgi:hypothetical protein